MAAHEQKLLAAYLAVGEDELKRRTVIERLRKRVQTMGDLEFNHDVFDGATASGSDIAIASNTFPFASPVRLVEVSHAEKLSKADAEVVVAYLTAPSDTTIVLFSAEKLAKNTRLYKAIAALGKGAVIDCSPMKRYELAKALRSMAVGHGFTLTERAADKLLELVGEDTVRLDSELRKLALAHKGGEAVTDREVAALVTQTNEAKPWELADAFSRRDIRACLALLDKLPSSSPFALVSLCTNRMRELACAQSLCARGQAHLLGATLKVPDWRVKNHVSWSRNFSERELREAFSSIRECERAMKSGSDPAETFKTWLVTTLAK